MNKIPSEILVKIAEFLPVLPVNLVSASEEDFGGFLNHPCKYMKISEVNSAYKDEELVPSRVCLAKTCKYFWKMLRSGLTLDALNDLKRFTLSLYYCSRMPIIPRLTMTALQIHGQEKVFPLLDIKGYNWEGVLRRAQLNIIRETRAVFKWPGLAPILAPADAMDFLGLNIYRCSTLAKSIEYLRLMVISLCGADIPQVHTLQLILEHCQRNPQVQLLGNQWTWLYCLMNSGRPWLCDGRVRDHLQLLRYSTLQFLPYIDAETTDTFRRQREADERVRRAREKREHQALNSSARRSLDFEESAPKRVKI